MTTYIQAKDLGYTLGTKRLFENLNLTVNQGDRIGLVGHNGVGKTSLLNLLAEKTQPDAGMVTTRRGLRVATVEQFLPEVLRSLDLRAAVLEVLPEDERLPYRAETILTDLGFSDSQLTMPVERLSGGQQNIALLARAQILEPDMLLMDEPGNHMDVSALAALHRYLNEQGNLTYMMISHDRDLLQDCCTHTVFVRDLTTYSFALPYGQAREALRQQDEQADRRLQVEEKEIDRIRTSAKRLAQWGRVYDNEDLARKAKTMQLRAEKLEADKTFVTQGSGLKLSLGAGAMRSKRAVALENLEVRTPDDKRCLLTCDYLIAHPGDRIALLGVNGVGKSTTIRRILAASETAADQDESVRFNPNVVVGYVDQELNAFTQALGRFDWLSQRVKVGEPEIKSVLLHAGVAYKDFDQPVNTLSGGEKVRMMFMALQLRAPNFIVLDEPTNHIDLESREELEAEIKASGATFLITSHDRRFLAQVCNRFWLIHEGRLSEVDSLDDYYQRVLNWLPSTKTSASTGAALEEFHSEESLLTSIEVLEKLLADDRARKPKFQKPHKQVEWQEQIRLLWAKLDQGLD